MVILAVPTDKLPVDDSFNMYIAVATENGSSKNYDAKDIAEIKNVSKALSTGIEKIGEVAPSDRSFKAGEIRNAKRHMIEKFNSDKDEKYNRLLAEQTQALFQPSTDVKEYAGAQELRDSFKQFAGDGPLIMLFASKLTDAQFDVLRFSQPTPIVRKDTSGIVTSVELAPMVPIQIERDEMLRRRPATAERLRIFAIRKQTFRGLSKTLSDLVDQGLESY